MDTSVASKVNLPAAMRPTRAAAASDHRPPRRIASGRVRSASDASAMSATGVASGAIPGMNGVAVCAEARRLSRMASCSWGSRIGFDMLVAP